MNRIYNFCFFVSVGLILFTATSCTNRKKNIDYFRYDKNIQRHWLGQEYWGNRLQDWRVNDGRIECLNQNRKLRTVHLLPYSLKQEGESLNMKIKIGSFLAADTSLLVDNNDDYYITPEAMAGEDTYAGFLIGAGNLETDYRARALTHRTFGKNGGFLAVVKNNELAILNMEDSLRAIPAEILIQGNLDLTTQDVQLIADLKNNAITLSAIDLSSKKELAKIRSSVNPEKITGNVGIVANGSAGNQRLYWFEKMELSGNKLDYHEDQHFGPVVSTLYTVHDNILKLTAQLVPLSESDAGEVFLEIKQGQEWKETAKTTIIKPGYTATFRVEDWNDKQAKEYRVKYIYKGDDNRPKTYYYGGTIRSNPKDSNELIVAAFTGNSPASAIHSEYDFSRQSIWFPHNDLIPKVEKLNPDLLVYTGDQVYEWLPTQPDKSGNNSSYLDYLYKWYLWGWSHGELTRDVPTVCLLDDHDVYQGNLWGAKGRKTNVQEDGGYIMSADFVNMAQRTQVSHHPAPYDPTPVERGIDVYYGRLNWGNIDFALLEDRKFKSGPNTTLPEEVQTQLKKNPFNVDPAKLDVPGATLLSERQLKFISEWAQDWENASMKAALCQTIFAGLMTKPTEGKNELIYEKGFYPKNHQIEFSPDANSWPLTPRNKALKEIRKGFAFMIAGDTHLGSIIHHGTDDWGDAGYSFCVPSIANRHVRVWHPPYPGRNAIDSLPPYTGEYKDAAGAKITVYAVSNPHDVSHDPANLYDLAPGFGIIRFNKPEKTITMENWPRYADPATDKQFPGWPKTISMYDNYAKKPIGYLPGIHVKGVENPPVIQVIYEKNNEIIYTVRMKDMLYVPAVFKHGTYTVIVSEPGTGLKKEINHISSEKITQEPVIVNFSKL
jgi:alkaline phosphatase D